MGESRKTQKAQREVWCSDEALVVRAMAAMTDAVCPGCGITLGGLEEARCSRCHRHIRLVVRSSGCKAKPTLMLVLLGTVLTALPIGELVAWRFGNETFILRTAWLGIESLWLVVGLTLAGVSCTVVGLGARYSMLKRAGMLMRLAEFAIVSVVVLLLASLYALSSHIVQTWVWP